MLSIYVFDQFVTLDGIYSTVGECHKCAGHDQGLHYFFVAVIETVGHGFAGGRRTSVSFCHDYPSFVALLCLRERSVLRRVLSGAVSTHLLKIAQISAPKRLNTIILNLKAVL